MTPYTNTNPCPRCGGLDYIYMVGDGYINPDYPTHYSHASTSSTCKKCGYQENFWNHKDGFVPQKALASENNMTECYFSPTKEISSSTICAKCGKEKMLHTIGENIEVNKVVIITKQQMEADNPTPRVL